MPRITIGLTDDEVAALLGPPPSPNDRAILVRLATLATDAIQAQSSRTTTDEEEAFLARMRPWAAEEVWNNTLEEQRKVERLLDLLDARDDLIHVLQQDGTGAQDQARGLERARCVEWLRSLAEERRLGGEVATAAGAVGTAKLLYLEDSALRHAANVLAAESSSPDDPPSRARAASARLRARLAALEEACRPFAGIASDALANAHAGDVMLSDLGAMGYGGGPTIGDCRRLATLLEASE